MYSHWRAGVNGVGGKSCGFCAVTDEGAIKTKDEKINSTPLGIPFDKLRAGSRPAGENAGLRHDTNQ
jgi:hypothetical protein